jgi:hypothetical protein
VRSNSRVESISFWRPTAPSTDGLPLRRAFRTFVTVDDVGLRGMQVWRG